MTDELKGPSSPEFGQGAFDSLPGAAPNTEPFPDQSAEGQPASEPQPAPATPTGPEPSGQQEPEHFFDPKTFEEDLAKLPPEMQAHIRAYSKGLQGSYTKRMQALAEHRKKIDAYDAFYKSPVESLQQMALQMGYVLTPAQAQAMNQNMQHGQAPQQAAANAQQQGEWEPQTWDDVIARAEERAEQRVLQRLQPVLQQVQGMREHNVEQMLDQNYPDWRTYETEMTNLVQSHPTLANDPAMLYRLAVPPEVQESRVYQRLLAQQSKKVQSSQVSGPSSTTKQPSAVPDGPMDFNRAVSIAKQRLASQGIHPPG